VSAPPAAAETPRPAPAAEVRPPAAEPVQAVGTASSGDGSYDEYDLPPLVLPNEAGYAEPEPAASAAGPTMDEAPAQAPSAAQPVAAGGDAGPIDGARLRRAWTGILQESEGLPPGMAGLLRGAQVSAEGRTVRLALPPAHPALEKLSGAAARRGIEDALARRLGGRVTLAVATGAAAAIDPRQGRITAESAKKDRLARMMEGEPVLSAAVQAWDLELVD
jgi:hypothetical protein